MKIHKSLELSVLNTKAAGTHFNPSAKVMSIEMSMLKELNFSVNRVWNDACDEGFILESEKTGNKVLFTLSREQKDDEGDLMFIDFVPYKAENLKGWVFRIYND